MTSPRPWTWPWLVATTLAKALLATVVCLGAWGALPAAVGWLPTTVSSGSMLPRLQVGDVAVSRPVGATLPPLDSVLLFDDPDHPGRLRLHRFVRVDEQGRLVMRGDANPAEDSSPVEPAALRGIGTLRVPAVGLPVVWLREGRWLPLALGLAALLALGALAARSRAFGFPEPDEDDPPGPDGPGGTDGSAAAATGPTGTGGGTATSGVPWASARAALAAGLASVLLGVLAVPGGAAFADTTATTGSLGAATWFRCAGAVAGGTPYLWYRLDETSSSTSSATDSSGNGRTGAYGTSGKTAGAVRACGRDTGTAMRFDGSAGYLSSPQVSGAAPNVFTLEVWFRTTTGRGGKLLGWGSARTGVSGSYDRHLYLTDAGRVVFGVYPNAVRTVSSTATYNDGSWHQATATLSGAGMRLYVDGDLVDSDTTVTSGEATSNGYWRIAYDSLDNWDYAPTSRYFAGTLDDVAVYLTALTPTQVAAHHQAGV